MRPVPPRLTLLVILAMFTLPLVLAWMMNFGSFRYEAHRTVNLGTLVSPVVPLDWSGVEPITDGATAARLSGFWVILFAVPASCDMRCLESVAQLRQVRRAAGKDQNRIKIVLLVESAISPARMDELLVMDPGFNLVGSPSAALLATLVQAANSARWEYGQSPIYLLDPLGNIMMTYTGESSPNRLSKDLKRLVAWSTQDKRS